MSKYIPAIEAALHPNILFAVFSVCRSGPQQEHCSNCSADLSLAKVNARIHALIAVATRGDER